MFLCLCLKSFVFGRHFPSLFVWLILLCPSMGEFKRWSGSTCWNGFSNHALILNIKYIELTNYVTFPGIICIVGNIKMLQMPATREILRSWNFIMTFNLFDVLWRFVLLGFTFNTPWNIKMFLILFNCFTFINECRKYQMSLAPFIWSDFLRCLCLKSFVCSDGFNRLSTNLLCSFFIIVQSFLFVQEKQFQSTTGKGRRY